MAKPVIKSAAAERWPVIEILAPLGWTIAEIAAAIGWSRATVAKDLQAKGGMNRLWPDRPRKPAEVYAATFRYYVHHVDALDPGVADSIREFLNMDLIEETQRIGLDTFELLMLPVHWTDPFASLLRAINHTFFRNNWDRPTPLQDYLEAVRSGTQPVPRGSGEVINYLKRRLTHVDRTSLRSADMEAIHASINMLLRREDAFGKPGPLLTERESFILQKRYGLLGVPSQTREDVAHELSLTKDRVRQIEAKALAKLRWCDTEHGLLDSFRTLKEVHAQRDQARAELAALAQAYVQQQHRLIQLCQAVNDGDLQAAAAIVTADLPEPDLNNPNLWRRCDELELSVRTANVLMNSGIEFIWQICILQTEQAVLKLKNAGRKTLNEITDVLAELDLQIGMNPHMVRLRAQLIPLIPS